MILERCGFGDSCRQLVDGRSARQQARKRQSIHALQVFHDIMASHPLPGMEWLPSFTAAQSKACLFVREHGIRRDALLGRWPTKADGIALPQDRCPIPPFGRDADAQRFMTCLHGSSSCGSLRTVLRSGIGDGSASHGKGGATPATPHSSCGRFPAPRLPIGGS